MATRRPLTDRQREIRSTANAHARMQADATREIAARESIHQQTRISTESQLASDRSGRSRNAAVTGAITSTATPSGDSNLIMTTIFLVFGLIIVYILVHNPGPTTGWLGGLGNALHALSSNTPLFTTTAKVP